MPEPREEFLPTRWSLLSRLKDWGDQESWREFFDAYWKLIYSTALKAGLTHTEAQEVVQETVISVARNMGEFQASPASGSFKAWLLNITRWRITDQLRKRPKAGQFQTPQSNDVTRTATVERVPDPNPAGFDEAWDHEYEKNLLDLATERVKARVKPEAYQIFDLIVNKSWRPLKISRRLHISLAQVYYAKYKVTALMKSEIRKLERNGV